MGWLWELIIAALSVGGNALVFAYMLGRKTAKFEASIASLVKDIREHDARLGENDSRFDRHEGKIIRLTVAGAKTSTALMMKFSNPHPDPVFAEIARSYDRIHGEDGNGTVR